MKRKEERLQKVMAHAGVASRRASEKLIEQGRVRVNGEVVTQMGVTVDPRRDVIAVDGEKLPQKAEKLVYLILNKPPQVLSSVHDDRGRKTVVDMVEVEERVYPAGRLDLKSEGLILLTNDGALTKRLTHPRYHLEKEYHVLVRGHPDDQTLDAWEEGGIMVYDKPSGPAIVEKLKQDRDSTWLKVILTEGRKRQIRIVAQTLGHSVKLLRRVRIGPIKLGHLKLGQWRYLKNHEVNRLRREII